MRHTPMNGPAPHCRHGTMADVNAASVKSISIAPHRQRPLDREVVSACSAHDYILLWMQHLKGPEDPIACLQSTISKTRLAFKIMFFFRWCIARPSGLTWLTGLHLIPVIWKHLITAN
jgi:hypothetical protein